MENLLLTEAHAIGALIHSGIALVGADLNAVQRAVVLVLAVMCTGVDGAFDALISGLVHTMITSFIDFKSSMPEKTGK